MQYDFDEVLQRRETACLKYDALEYFFGDKELLPLWVADMDFRTPDFIMEAIRERTRHEILGYSLRPDSFFKAVIEWHRRRQHWKIQRDWILFSPGVVAALNMAVRAYTNEGDKVIVQSPVYHPFFSVIRDNKRIPLINRLVEEDGIYRMDLEQLRKDMDHSVKLILICHPHNPVGRVWREADLTQLAELCLEHNILMVSDEIHSDLLFPPHRHIPLASLGAEISDRTVTCLSASKTFNLAGLSSSVVVIENKKLREKFNHELNTGHFQMGNIFGNVAMETAYAMGEDWLTHLMHYLRDNRDYMFDFVRDELPGVYMQPPEATYLAWLDMRALEMKPKALREFMTREARLALNDGPSFGPGGNGFQRLNFACPRSRLEQALGQLRDALRRR